mmetsp:Transcript_6916/g.19568  ORF Transcript_6916/g.19568 Transcript_6916/m.19568 type:complete len:126 (-) Transcript_6916:1216-1593(-)
MLKRHRLAEMASTKLEDEDDPNAIVLAPSSQSSIGAESVRVEMRTNHTHVDCTSSFLNFTDPTDPMPQSLEAASLRDNTLCLLREFCMELSPELHDLTQKQEEHLAVLALSKNTRTQRKRKAPPQ